ncbi:MAG TPA: SDR family oxidoreductase [Nevskiaceae bacterium]|nr:SDR family oxidoreductase [Nevskiaceae bacterium]
MSTPNPAAPKPAHPHCLIVGVGPGIGQALALAFARENYNVSLLARNPEKLADTVAMVRQKTARDARAFRADAGVEASLKAAMVHARRAFGELDVLIFNAAHAERGKPTTLSVEQLVSNFTTNVGGALVAAREAANDMRRKKAGSILFTGGGFAHEPAAEYASLSLDKAALRSLTYTLAQELGGDGIHVATVTVYGFVQTGTRFDPSRIAQQFVALHRQPKGHFDTEVVFK